MHGKNNFDFLRILAAFSVLFSHQYSLTGHPQPTFGSYQTLGGVALNVFFSVSGYLVAQSWDQDPNAIRFAGRRVLRIWPGLAVMVLIVVLVWGPLLSNLSLREYIFNPATWKYLKVLWLSSEYHLPGVFEKNPLTAVNGSLWTLAVEARWYFYLMIIGSLGLLRWRVVPLIIWSAMTVNYFFLHDIENAYLHGGARWWDTELGLFFVSGLCLYYYRVVWQNHAVIFACTVGLLCTILFLSHYRLASFTIITPFIVVWIGTRSFPYLHRAGRYGDPSYGIYIYAFVIQQTLIDWTQNSMNLGLGFALAASLAAAAGFASWHLVEKQALRLKTLFLPSVRSHSEPRLSER